MSQNIVTEVTFLLHSFFMGILITFVYDGFLILRRLIRHNLFLISLEDLIFWIACAIGVFYMLYEENNGILRWFAVFGAAMGMILYKISVSAFVVNMMSTIIARIFHFLLGILRFLFKPVKFICRKIFRIYKPLPEKSRKIFKAIKKRLTARLKLLKITLCKR